MGNNESKTNASSTESMADTPFATAPASPEPSAASKTAASSQETGTTNSEQGSEEGSEEDSEQGSEDGSEDGSESEEKSQAESSIAEHADEESKDFDFKEWAEDFFEREYREHQWSAGAHAPSAHLTTNNEASGESLRPLGPGEELLSESEASEDEEEDEDVAMHQWHCQLDSDPAAAKEATLGELQLAMDMDKAAWSGTAGPPPRPKSVLEKRGIGDYVERGRRATWAAEMAKEHPGRYAPYPGRPARAPPRRSAADKARQLQRKK